MSNEIDREELINHMTTWYDNMDWGVDEETGIPFMANKDHERAYKQIVALIKSGK
jgi:hypothetical protein